MNLRPAHLLVPLLGLALGLLLPFEKPKLPIKKKKGAGTAAAALPDVGGMWSNARFLSERMDEACAWVKEATGMDFVERPSARRSSIDEVAAFLREDMGKAFRTLGAADDAGVAAMGRDLAGRVVAAYDPKANVVHILPENAVAAAKAAGDDSLLGANVLRLVLVRMAVVAVDRQILTAWKDALDAASTPDAVLCAGAVLEGHAQYETERIAKNWANQEDGFAADTYGKLVALLTARAGTENEAAAADADFAIVQGQKFMAMVAKRRRPGIKGVLAKPPTDRNLILKPSEFLSPAPAGGAVSDRVRKEFGAILAEAEGWSVTEEAAPEADAEAWMTPLGKSIWSAELAAFRSGYRWIAKNEEGASRTVYLFEFRTGGMAESFVNLAKAAAEKAGDKVQAGAGRDGGLVGFASTRAAQGAGGIQETRQLTSEGAYVIGIVSADGVTKREAWDDALEAAAEVLAKEQKTRKNRREK